MYQVLTQALEGLASGPFCAKFLAVLAGFRQNTAMHIRLSAAKNNETSLDLSPFE